MAVDNVELEILELRDDDEGVRPPRRYRGRRAAPRATPEADPDAETPLPINISVNNLNDDDECAGPVPPAAPGSGSGSGSGSVSLRASLLTVLGKLAVWRRCARAPARSYRTTTATPAPHASARERSSRTSSTSDYFKSFYDCGATFSLFIL